MAGKSQSFIAIMMMFFRLVCSTDQDLVESTKPKIGLALSGGMQVGALAGASILRGFQMQKIHLDSDEEGKECRPSIQAFDYVSGLSGGIIPTIQYTYGQDSTTEELLDAEPSTPILDPADITKESLERDNDASILHDTTATLFFGALPSSLFSFLTLNPQAAWTGILYNKCLKALGIKRNKNFGLKPVSPTSDSEQANTCSLGGSCMDDTIIPRADVRAIPLITFAMAGQVGKKKLFTGGHKKGAEFAEAIINIREHAKGLAKTFVSPKDVKGVLEKVNNVVYVPYVASPEGTGTAFNLPMTLDSGETFDDLSGMCKPCDWGYSKGKRGNKFSLELALAMGSSLFTLNGLGSALGEGGKGDNVKTLNTATNRRVVKTGKDKESELLFSDGGLVETLGVPALVQRKTRYIISSICGHGSERKYSDQYNKTKGHDLTTWLMEGPPIGMADVASYFGFYSGKNQMLLLNHIFSGGEARLNELRNKFDALYEAGMPLITTLRDLDVIDNPYWGTVAGEKVDLTIIYWTTPKIFSSQVPRDAVPPPDDVNDTMDKETGDFTNEELSDLPHFGGLSNFETKTTIWKVIRTGALSRTQVNMMSYLGAWMVKEAWNGLYLDGKEMFGGFKEILEKSD